MTTDQNDDMATMPIPELVAAIREKAPDVEPLQAMLFGVLSGRLMREYERANDAEDVAAGLSMKITNCDHRECPCQ